MPIVFTMEVLCQYCKLAGSGKVNFTQRRCPDCPWDCHAAWHQSCFDEIRTLWIDKQEYKNLKTSSTATCDSSPPGSLAGPSQNLQVTPGRSETLDTPKVLVRVEWSLDTRKLLVAGTWSGLLDHLKCHMDLLMVGEVVVALGVL